MTATRLLPVTAGLPLLVLHVGCPAAESPSQLAVTEARYCFNNGFAEPRRFLFVSTAEHPELCVVVYLSLIDPSVVPSPAFTRVITLPCDDVIFDEAGHFGPDAPAYAATAEGELTEDLSGIRTVEYHLTLTLVGPEGVRTAEIAGTEQERSGSCRTRLPDGP